MRKILLLSILILGLHNLNAQFSDLTIIDDSPETLGIRHMAASDFNKNGFNDIVVAQGSIIDQVSIYWNLGDENFNKEIIDHSISDPLYIGFGDFNSNNFKDLIVVTESDGEIFIYDNLGGEFQERRKLGSVESLGKSVAISDFDGDGHLDFIAIGRHSIDFYRNNGNGNFTVEQILTTSTSPDILELWTIALADINGNGITDVVTGETIGIVAYLNDGNGNFTPHLISKPQHHTVNALADFDATGNQKPDLLFHSNSEVGFYTNHSVKDSIHFEYHSELFIAPANSIRRFVIGDFMQNGSEDLYFTSLGIAYLAINNSGLLSNKIQVHAEPDLFIWTPHAADITGNGINELIWAAAGGTLAYHSHETVGLNSTEPYWSIFPNPTLNSLKIMTESAIHGKVSVFSLTGELLFSRQETLPGRIDLMDIPSGMYFIQIETGQGTFSEKIFRK